MAEEDRNDSGQKESTMKLFGLTVLILAALLNVEVVAAEPPITDVVFFPDGKSVIASSQSGLQILDWPSLIRQRVIDCSAANIHCVAVSPDGKFLAAGGGNPSEDGSVEVFSWPGGERVAVLGSVGEGRHKDSVRAVVWESSAKILTAAFDRQIRVWGVEDTSSPQPSSPSGRGSQRLAVASQTEWDCVRTFRGHSKSVSSLCLLPDEKIFVSAGDDQSLRVWNLKTGKLIRSLNQHTRAVHSLARRPSKEGLPMVASASGDRTIRFWQPTIGRMVRYVRLESEPLCLAWLDEDFIVAGCVDGRVRVVNADEVTVTANQAAIDGWVYAIAVSPIDRSVVAAGTGGQIRRIELRPADDRSVE